MKSLNIKLNLNGSISVKEVDSLFLNENNACEVSIDYSSVVKEGWNIAVDLQPQYEQATEINSTTPGFISDENNVFIFLLSENYTKRNELRIQPKQVKSNGIVMDKIKYDFYTKKFKQSINATESEEAVNQSIADQILASEQVRENNETVRNQNELARETNENARNVSEEQRLIDENIRQENELIRVENEEARKVFESYDNLKQYELGNKVSYNGSSYYCIQNSIGNDPSNQSYWLLIASKGNPGYTPVKGTDYFDGDDGLSAYQVWLAAGNVGTEAQFLAKLKGNQWRGAYNAGTQYVVDDVVGYNGSSYICILASLGNLPSNTTYWSLFAQAGEVTTAAMNAALANKADKLLATNLVNNGGFSNGTTGWIGTSLASFNVLSNEAIMLANSSTDGIYQAITTIVSNKYFVRGKVKATSNLVRLFLGSTTVSHSGSGLYETFAFIHTATSTAHGFQVADFRTSGFDNFYAKELSIIDLTVLFGAGKEPTKEQMDWIFTERERLSMSHLNGTAELIPTISLLNLVNTKADKTQEAWITATLSNGWSGTLQYAKNGIGQVTIKFNLVAGTSSIATTFATLPTSYRPLQIVAFIGNNSSTGLNGDFRIGSSGVIQVISGVSAGNTVQGMVIFLAEQ